MGIGRCRRVGLPTRVRVFACDWIESDTEKERERERERERGSARASAGAKESSDDATAATRK
jgi:hypothetical protein